MSAAMVITDQCRHCERVIVWNWALQRWVHKEGNERALTEGIRAFHHAEPRLLHR